MKEMKSIEWATATYNPVVGACPHRCAYCYVSRMKRFPHIAEKYSGEVRLVDIPVPKTGVLFVASSNDVAALPGRDLKELVARVAAAPIGVAVYLTKDPAKLEDVEFPTNAWVGTTYESSTWSGSGVAPPPPERLAALKKVDAENRWVSAEPAVSPFGVDAFVGGVVDAGVKVVVVGGASGRAPTVCGMPVVKPSERSKLVTECERHGIRLFRKPNLADKMVPVVTPAMWKGV